MESTNAFQPTLSDVSIALTLGMLVYAVLILFRLSANERKKWWRHGFGPLPRGWLPALILAAALTTLLGVLRQSDALALLGACSSCVAAAVGGMTIQQFLKDEARRRKVEMDHWTVRKPAEQRMAHQAMLRRQELDRVQAAALRSLMDPHFLFNALNGIVHDMLNREWFRALHNLRAFNRLAERQIRSGQQGWLTLEDEWSGLRDYLTLEVRRLDRPIAWELTPLPTPMRDRRIPALMVQPLVENALWHGLGGTSGTGGGLIRVSVEAAGNEHLEIQVFNSNNPDAERPHDLVRPEKEREYRRHASDLIRHRLRLMDRDGQSRLQVRMEQQGTTACLVLPCGQTS